MNLPCPHSGYFQCRTTITALFYPKLFHRRSTIRAYHRCCCPRLSGVINVNQLGLADRLPFVRCRSICLMALFGPASGKFLCLHPIFPGRLCLSPIFCRSFTENTRTAAITLIPVDHGFMDSDCPAVWIFSFSRNSFTARSTSVRSSSQFHSGKSRRICGK